MAGRVGLIQFDIESGVGNLGGMGALIIILICEAVIVTSCAVDPRWGERKPTNPSLRSAPGVDARWGERRHHLRGPLEWEYEGLEGNSTESAR